jgi:UDP-N-acetylmuramoylalanine--D-glutamate ligase
MIDFLKKKLQGKRVLILGFGREGKASYQVIRKALPTLPLTIADTNPSIGSHPLLNGDAQVVFVLGPGYLDHLNRFDLIIKSPGISFLGMKELPAREKITSQSDLFLQVYSNQTIGITGTKGKSTTASLLHHVLKKAELPSILLGNIGRPAFECLEDILPETHIVFELSSHQLEYITRAPHISVLLNLFQEHLDAYASYEDYQLAKMNITKCQTEEDYFIYNADDSLVTGWVNEFGLVRNFFPFAWDMQLADGSYVNNDWVCYAKDCVEEQVLNLSKKRKLKGDHNLRNIMAVITVCKILGVENELIQEGIAGFTGLEHRLEYVGAFHGIRFYNDSIATIPEATIEAIKTIGDVDTIILGGFDRGIDYSGLASFLGQTAVRNLILVGDAGKRIMESLVLVQGADQTLFPVNRFDDFLPIALQHTRKDAVCLLSPAASSYDEFSNFEFRGKRFKELVGKELI